MRSDSALIQGNGKACTASRSNASEPGNRYRGLGCEGHTTGPLDESTCMRPERQQQGVDAAHMI